MDNSLLSQGVELMLYGMGVVFTFLALLVLATAVLSALVARFPEPEAETPPSRASAPEHDTRLLAVIASAVAEHRRRKS